MSTRRDGTESHDSGERISQLVEQYCSACEEAGCKVPLGPYLDLLIGEGEKNDFASGVWAKQTTGESVSISAPPITIPTFQRIFPGVVAP